MVIPNNVSYITAPYKLYTTNLLDYKVCPVCGKELVNYNLETRINGIYHVYKCCPIDADFSSRYWTGDISDGDISDGDISDGDIEHFCIAMTIRKRDTKINDRVYIFHSKIALTLAPDDKCNYIFSIRNPDLYNVRTLDINFNICPETMPSVLSMMDDYKSLLIFE
jgi:hypothetical protein